MKQLASGPLCSNLKTTESLFLSEMFVPKLLTRQYWLGNDTKVCIQHGFHICTQFSLPYTVTGPSEVKGHYIICYQWFHQISTACTLNKKVTLYMVSTTIATLYFASEFRLMLHICLSVLSQIVLWTPLPCIYYLCPCSKITELND